MVVTIATPTERKERLGPEWIQFEPSFIRGTDNVYNYSSNSAGIIIHRL